MDRLFLDAKILFSAAYRPNAGLLRLWRLSDVVLCTGHYALEEARSTHLITGDLRHFGPYFGKKLAGILVLSPADYLRLRSSL